MVSSSNNEIKTHFDDFLWNSLFMLYDGRTSISISEKENKGIAYSMNVCARNAIKDDFVIDTFEKIIKKEKVK